LKREPGTGQETTRGTTGAPARAAEAPLSHREQRAAMRLAVASACIGGVPQVLARESSVMILYATMLGAGPFLTMAMTSLEYLSTFVLILPVAYAMEHAGKKRLILPALAAATGSLLAAGAAGWLPAGGRRALTAGLVVFSMAMAVYIAGWFPLLRDIIPPRERGRFFGRMRMSWQAVAAAYLMGSALIVGKQAPLLVVQVIVLVAALLMVGRLVLVSRIPEPWNARTRAGFGHSLRTLASQGPMRRFWLYVLGLFLFCSATAPVALVYARLSLGVPDNYLLLLSGCLNVGMIAGFYGGGHAADRWGTSPVFLVTHLALGLFGLSLLFITDFSMRSAILLPLLLAANGAAYAAATVATSTEIIGLAQPGFLNLSIAAGTALQYAGMGVGRFVAGLLLDSPLLPEHWTLFAAPLNRYHALFVMNALLLLLWFALLLVLPKVRTRQAWLPWNG
jgi:MFS family permease